MTASCVHYRQCSGCTRLHLPYVKQLYDKHKRVARALEPLLREPSVLQPIVPSPEPLGYRISTKLCLHEDPKLGRVIGLYEYARKKVVDIPKCQVHHARINPLAQKLLPRRGPLPAPFYNHLRKGFQAGCLKFLTVRVATESDAAAVVISHTGVAAEILQQLAGRFAHLPVSFYACQLRAQDGDQVLNDQLQYLSGPETLPYQLGSQRYDLPPQVFFQANGLLIQTFVEHITADMQGDVLWDLYGGFGSYTRPLVTRFQHISLIETNAAAIATAQQWARANGSPHVQAQTKTVEQFLKQQTEHTQRRVNYVIVNPPRAGLSAAVRQWFKKATLPALQELRYVSCDLSTLARDCEGLIKSRRWQLARVTPFDMFPQTEHVECVAILKRCVD